MRRWLRPWAASPLAGHATPPDTHEWDKDRRPSSWDEWLAWEHYLHHLRAERDAWRQRALDAEARLAGG